MKRTSYQHPAYAEDASEECREDYDECFSRLDRFGLGRGWVKDPNVTDGSRLDQTHLLLAIQQGHKDLLVDRRVPGQSQYLLLGGGQLVDPLVKPNFFVAEPLTLGQERLVTGMVL